MLYTFFHKNGGVQVLTITLDGYTVDILENLIHMGFLGYEVVSQSGKTHTGFTQNLLNSCLQYKF